MSLMVLEENFDAKANGVVNKCKALGIPLNPIFSLMFCLVKANGSEEETQFLRAKKEPMAFDGKTRHATSNILQATIRWVDESRSALKLYEQIKVLLAKKCDSMNADRSPLGHAFPSDDKCSLFGDSGSMHYSPSNKHT